MKTMFGIGVVALFLLWPAQSEARHGAARGERRIGGLVKRLVHPLQNLKDRRGHSRGGCASGNCR